MIFVTAGLTRNLLTWMPDQVRHDRMLGFTLVELMISISIIAILTIAAIPSFSGFSKSQALTQAFKTLKSDLRIAQSRSISGAAAGSPAAAKAWGIYFSTAANNQYIIFVCTPAATYSDYTSYIRGNARCPSDVKTVNLGSQVIINGLTPASPLSLVFDSQNGSVYANGSQVGASVTLTYTDNSGPQTVTITRGGGISD